MSDGCENNEKASGSCCSSDSNLGKEEVNKGECCGGTGTCTNSKN